MRNHRLVYGNHLHFFRKLNHTKLHPYRSYFTLDVSNIRYSRLHFSIIPKNQLFSYMASKFLLRRFDFFGRVHYGYYIKNLSFMPLELWTRHLESGRWYPHWLFLFLVHRGTYFWKTFMQIPYKWKNSDRYMIFFVPCHVAGHIHYHFYRQL